MNNPKLEDNIVNNRLVNILKLVILCVLTFLNFIGISFCQPVSNKQQVDLLTKRQGFKTYLVKKEPAPQPYKKEKPPENVRELIYLSGGLKLKAWIAKPKTDKKYPAVVYLHGGFSFAEEDWNQASPFLKAGYIVMMPMLRGENGNPGYFEGFYSEVKDVLAAGRYLSSLSYVDSNKVFIAGHSIGGTLAILASMCKSPYKAAASFSGSPNLRLFLQSDWAKLMPFNLKNTKEIDLRCPFTNVACLQIPIFLFAGKEELWFVEDNESFLKKAKKLNKVCQINTLPGDHFSSVKPAIEMAIQLFSQQVK